MVESKKTSEKTERSPKPSSTGKLKDEVKARAAVKKTAAAKSASPLNDSAKPQNQPSIGQDRRQPAILVSKSVAVVMAGVALVVALTALTVSVVIYQQIAKETVSGQSAATAILNDFNQADLDKLSQRLDNFATLIAQNADHFASLQQEFTSARAKRPSHVPAMTNLDDLIARIGALEAAGTDQMMALGATDEAVVKGGFDTTQIGLLVAAGLLAENLAGRNIEVWAGVLDDLQWPAGVDVVDRDIIRGAARTPVDSRADLLSLGRLQLAPMVQV